MQCDGCNTKTTEMKSVPFAVYESSADKATKRENKMLVILLISVFLLFVSNMIWLYSWMQFDYSDVSIGADNSQTDRYA